LATGAEMNAISEQTGLVVSTWSARFTHGSSPFTSTIVFLVRAGNPKAVNDWDDLVRPDVLVVVFDSIYKCERLKRHGY
jgi:sulfate/thiosulfate transport system substrate-binding protein